MTEKVLIDGVQYRPVSTSDELPDNWQELVTRRLIASGRGHTLICDSDVPGVFFRATGRKYSADEICINDLRRFVLIALCNLPIRLDEE